MAEKKRQAEMKLQAFEKEIERENQETEQKVRVAESQYVRKIKELEKVNEDL